MMPLRKLIPGITVRAEVFIGICMLLFIGMTIWYVSFQTTRSQHVFCELVNTLNNAPKPPAGSPQKNPSRAYDLQIAKDIADLKARLEC